MRQPTVSKKYLIAAALAFGLAGAASAQPGLPDAQQQGDVSFVSGGVGQDESTAFQRSESSWPLALRFTGAGGEYLADVHVSVLDAHGGEVLKTDARGPYMLVRLQPGRYTVHASYNGNEQTHAVTVPAKGGVKAAFSWKAQ
ncbi:carboxypeptidase regulator [Burkholderia sp. ABCPW 14]|uniref:carboxypeptidase-like regulatory domain-containing protein n=1 Tax=Burkholderia sp. ABCPW 14 TaxID=1637860 RepID=UPI000770C98F|nr:carboxypeptidase-like regulatory domain-containing protein [Burkholderia sp. ABCPW 14]KVD79398.1 carboxypeptidase regulator [Burkholderia sp. ABCPW 14]